MPDERDPTSFDRSRAELFDALGHPTRIRILHALEDGPLGFLELRRKVGLESSGHLQFHLGKLNGLVSTSTDGMYALTDDGRDALRVMARSDEISGPSAGLNRKVLVSRLALAAFVVATIVVAALAGALYFQSTSAAAETRQQLVNLTQQLTNLTDQIQQTQKTQEDLSSLRGFFVSGIQLSVYDTSDDPHMALPVYAPNLYFAIINRANSSITSIGVFVDGSPISTSKIGATGGLPLAPGQSVMWAAISDRATTAGAYALTFVVTFGDGSTHSFETLATVA